MDKIFLGGTCADTTWRDELIPYIDGQEGLEYFNPIVKDWNEDCIKIEDDEKENKCNIHLYVITPEMKGVYSIAEVINSVYQACLNTVIEKQTSVEKVIFATYGDFSKDELKSFDATFKMCHDIEKYFALPENSIVVTKHLDVIEDAIK